MLKSQGPIWGIRFQKCPAYGPTSIYAIGSDGLRIQPTNPECTPEPPETFHDSNILEPHAPLELWSKAHKARKRLGFGFRVLEFRRFLVFRCMSVSLHVGCLCRY